MRSRGYRGSLTGTRYLTEETMHLLTIILCASIGGLLGSLFMQWAGERVYRWLKGDE